MCDKLKANYRGFEIEAKREMSLGGDILLYYSVFRSEDGWEMTSGFTTGSDTVRDFIGYLKNNVDDCILNPKDWNDPRKISSYGG